MKNLSRPRALPMEGLASLCGRKNFYHFNFPLSDCKIIQLQTIFMTPAIHRIYTHDIVSGRNLINTFLTSLRYYKNIGCLTILPISLDSNTLNMFPIIKSEQNLGFDTFFVEFPYFDFVWIELSRTLLAQLTSSEINRICEFFTSYQSIPVVVLQYQDSRLQANSFN